MWLVEDDLSFMDTTWQALPKIDVGTAWRNDILGLDVEGRLFLFGWGRLVGVLIASLQHIIDLWLLNQDVRFFVTHVTVSKKDYNIKQLQQI